MTQNLETLRTPHAARRRARRRAYFINLSGVSTRDPAASHPVPLSDKPL